MEDNKIYAVIDTNVLVSGLLARNGSSAVVKVFEAVMAGRITPITCDEIISEYSEVLKRSKVCHSQQEQHYKQCTEFDFIFHN